MGLDQFYTKDDVAARCYSTLCERINIEEYDVLLEPSAGKGAFFKLLPESKRAGVDLEPKYDGVVKQNFFDYIPQTNKTYIVLGNPPFGRVSSLAVKFFNHAAEFADIIAFIIPRTFKRVSLQNQLNLNFRLVYCDDLSLNPCCFEPKMSAKCCFQIWERSDVPRYLTVYRKEHKDFAFVPYGPMDAKKQPTPPQLALFDFAIRAYGSNCGSLVLENLENLRPKSYHFIKSNIDTEILKTRMRGLDFSISKESCRQDSLGKGELIHIYTEKYGL